MTQRAAIGIDLGGTNLRWAVIDEQGKIIQQERMARPKSSEEIVGAIRESIAAAFKLNAELSGAGIAVPGVIRGGLVTSYNLGWNEYDLASRLEDLPIRIRLLNDMASGALGELFNGRARGFSNVVFVTVSTGIGAGVIVNGDVYRGSHGLAGEVGHMVVDLNGLLCGCGRRGCWEMIASGTAHKRRIREAFISGTWPNMDSEPRPEDVSNLARHGDKAARALILRTARYVGIGVANLANLYDPEAVIFTGGFARNNWDLIEDYLVTEVHEQAFTPNIQLLLTELADDAGLVGAAASILRR